MPSPLHPFAHRLRELRRDLDEDQEAFAARLGKHVNSLRRYEAGDIPDALQSVIELCKAVGVSADWLLGLRDNRSGLPAGHWVVDVDAYEHPETASDDRTVFYELPSNARLVDAATYVTMRRNLEKRVKGE